MRPIGDAGYVLSNKELFVLAGLTGSGALIGIDLGFSVTGNAQVIQLLEQVKSGLLRKRYIFEMGQGFGVDKNMFALIKVCCGPLAVLRLINRKNGRQLQRNYYFGSDITVELDEDPVLEASYILTPIVSAEKALQNAQEFFCEEEADVCPVNTYRLPLEKTRMLMDRVDETNAAEIEDLLARTGMEEPLSKDLVLALSKKAVIHSVLLLILNGEKNYKSFNIYSGEQFLWSITEVGDDPDSLEVSTVSGSDLGGILSQVVASAELLAL
ncbi:MAG TPA: hypothetical protein VHT96_18540 [Clostridia bacterium]|nr:hypothetical protein [Clostridia bacterium]